MTHANTTLSMLWHFNLRGLGICQTDDVVYK
uniref:Uncharacterized protein n=1 Tax=Anguilla anguilla TaxID=7936 RepID=A0A0E9VV65_ANGAN